MWKILRYRRFQSPLELRQGNRRRWSLPQFHDAVLDIGLFALGRAVKFDVSDFVDKLQVRMAKIHLRVDVSCYGLSRFYKFGAVLRTYGKAGDFRREDGI